MPHFTLSPYWRPRLYVTIDGLIILSIAMNGSISLDGRTGMVPTPCTVRTWGAQAIDYSWANLMYTMPQHTPSGRTQDVDGIRRLHISRFGPRESSPVHLTVCIRTSRLDQTCIRSDVLHLSATTVLKVGGFKEQPCVIWGVIVSIYIIIIQGKTVGPRAAIIRVKDNEVD